MLILSNDRVEEFINKILTGGSDQSSRQWLMSYQRFITEYFKSEKFKKKELLMLYMEVGTGKTLTSLVCGVDGLRDGRFKRVVVLSPKSVQDEFVKNLQLFYKLEGVKREDLKQNIEKNIVMIPYNANNACVQFEALGNLEHSLFIIDEAHLFMKSIIKVCLLPNQSMRNVGNAKRIYDDIRRLKSKKIILLTGTPSTKHPFETVPMFNLAGCELPTTFESFCDKFVDNDAKVIKNKNLLKSKLEGLVAYVGNEDKRQKLKASQLIVEDVEMSEGQYKQYLNDYGLELKERGFSSQRNIYGLMFGAKSSFHSKTFEDCVYWNDRLKGDGKDDDRYIGEGELKIDNEHCPKVMKMFEDSEKVNGLCVFYFRFVRMYGVDTMVEKLKKEGYVLCENDKEKVFEKKKKRFVLFTGSVCYSTRIKWKNIFNDERNKYGEYVKYLILSPSGSVGLTLRNVRYLGIGSCEFQYSTIRQIMGRCNRLGSHLDLPEKDRTLLNKLYLSKKNMKYYKRNKRDIDELCVREAPDWNEQAPTIERCIYQDSLYDDRINESFRECLKEVSIIK